VGGAIVQRVPVTQKSIHRAFLTGSDLWPENDSLKFADTESRALPHWWIGNSPAPPGWTTISPAAVLTDPAEYLAPSVIAIANAPADEFSPAALERLQQYVRDLGGTVLILGGDRAFGAGGYSGSVLDELSPLASDPPTPTTQWMLLTDASGSMAGDAGGRSRWAVASGALAAIVKELPPADTVSVGSFAANLDWWVNGKSVSEAKSLTLPPPNLAPSGPTNLQPVLEKLQADASGDGKKDLLLLTDGETKLAGLDTLAAAMIARNLRVHVLAIGSGSALADLQMLATATGGRYTAELDAAKWLAAVRKLVRGAMPDRMIHEPLDLVFGDGLATLPGRTVSDANRTWLKSGSIKLATARTADEEVPLIARRPLGTGTVIAAAYPPNGPELEAITALAASPPRDPKYQVDWSAAARGRVTIDAAGAEGFLNGLSFQLRMSGASDVLKFEQSAPGRYEAIIPPSAEPRLAKMFLGEHEIDRQPIAGRYPHEFDAIGLNADSLSNLANRSGGRLITPDQKRPISIPLQWDNSSLTPWLSIAAAVFIGLGLVQWKRSAGSVTPAAG